MIKKTTHSPLPNHVRVREITGLVLLLTTLWCASFAFGASGGSDIKPASVSWDKIRAVPMSGDLKVFWNVSSGDSNNAVQAKARGFLTVDLLNTYSDYPGKQKENISDYLKQHHTNPWKKPPFFERIVQRNLQSKAGLGAIFVHDIEFAFEENLEKAWADVETRTASGAQSKDAFATAYWQEWASWFALPCQWAKQQFPREPVGIYGIQPFRRDYHGIAGKSAQQVDGTHASDELLWQHIDPFVDFYVASIYVFYDRPDSIFYMAANVEENWQRTRRYGNKPVYAYEWMRYHNSNKKMEGQELAPYLIEAMAVLPFFSGGRGLVLWGSERKSTGQPYQMLPVFLNSLGRVSDLSAKISAATLVIDEPAREAWKAKHPLVRKLRVSPEEWIVMAVNPWQGEQDQQDLTVLCGTRSVPLTLVGKHTDIFHVQAGRVTKR